MWKKKRAGLTAVWMLGWLVMAARIVTGSPFVNVQNFGAVGDGKTDDTAAIQRAVDSLKKTGGYLLMKGHFVSSSITFPSLPQWLRIELDGTWRLQDDATLDIPSFVWLNGRGGARVFSHTARKPQAQVIPSSAERPTLRLSGNGPKGVSNIFIENAKGPALLLHNTKLVTLDNVTARAANAAQSYALKIDGSYWVHIKQGSFAAPPRAAGNVYITTTNTAPSEVHSASIDFIDCHLAGKGVVIAAERSVATQGQIQFNNVVYQDGTTPAALLDGKHGVVSHVIFDRFIVQGGRVPAFLAVRGPAGSVRNVTIKNAPLHSPLAIGGSIKGLNLYTGIPVFETQTQKLGSQNRQDTTMIQGGQFIGKFVAPTASK